MKGSFSRLDYQRNPGAAKSAVRSLRQTLPLGYHIELVFYIHLIIYKHEIGRIMCVYSAHDIYYRDEIGNV